MLGFIRRAIGKRKPKVVSECVCVWWLRFADIPPTPHERHCQSFALLLAISTFALNQNRKTTHAPTRGSAARARARTTNEFQSRTPDEPCAYFWHTNTHTLHPAGNAKCVFAITFEDGTHRRAKHTKKNARQTTIVYNPKAASPSSGGGPWGGSGQVITCRPQHASVFITDL